jgi:hypothetical protein
MKLRLLLHFCILNAGCFAQTPDSIYMPEIGTPQLYASGNQLGYPIIRLNTADKLDLQFDDLDADIKNYYYTFQLCNADWTPAIISEFDYIKGFSQSRIINYRNSSISLTRYTHYHLTLPEPNCIPIKSGNYLLKIFLDGDTSKLSFTRRFLVAEDAVNISAQILQPYNPDLVHTHQKLQFSINSHSLDISNPGEQVKVVLLQNNRWDNALHDFKPSFYSGNTLQYNSDDDYNFPGGKEWRWLDIQSFRYQSDRVQHVNYAKDATSIFVVPDADRSHQSYFYYKDYNGLFFIQTTESISPFTQTDYATVHFSFVPPGNSPFLDKDIYILGRLTDYTLNDSTKMVFNAARGIYEVSVFLKMGYYNYSYVTVNRGDPAKAVSFEFTEGNNVETENDYTILVYYRQLGGRADQLVGISKLNTLNGRAGQ